MMKFSYLCTIDATCDVCGKTKTVTGHNRVDAMDNLTIRKWVTHGDGRSRCPNCKGVWAINTKTSLRNRDIIQRHNNGESYEAIAASIGLTKQRVHQIYRGAMIG